jgi:hypothetical protein
MQALMQVNPVTYSVSAIRRTLDPSLNDGSPGMQLSLIVTAATGVTLWIMATMEASRKAKRSNA